MIMTDEELIHVNAVAFYSDSVFGNFLSMSRLSRFNGHKEQGMKLYIGKAYLNRQGVISAPVAFLRRKINEYI